MMRDPDGLLEAWKAALEAGHDPWRGGFFSAAPRLGETAWLAELRSRLLNLIAAATMWA